MQHNITDDTVAFIAHWEGFKAHAYYDATGHVWTIGYGHTKGVFKDMVCKAEALKWLNTDANRVAMYINSLDMNITQEQFDALVSFGYNVGTGNLRQSTLCASLSISFGSPMHKILCTVAPPVRRLYRFVLSGQKLTISASWLLQ